MPFKALKLYNHQMWKVCIFYQVFWPRKSYNPLTSARCARRAILCTVLPKPISSARIPLMPCKKIHTFTLASYYFFFIHAGLEKWSNLLSFRSSTERHFTSTALSFISRPYFFFPPRSIHTPRSHCKLDMPRGSAVCNLKSAQSLKLYAILRSRSLFSV